TCQMPKIEQVLSIFLASPGDVSDERGRVDAFVDEWNNRKRCIYPIIPRQPDSWLNPGHGYSTATRPQFHRLFLPAAGVPARSAATHRVRDHWLLPSAATSTTPHWHAPRRECH